MKEQSKWIEKKNNQRLVAVAVALLVVFFMFDRTSAQSVAELEETIRELAARTATLQAQLISLTEGATQASNTTETLSLARNLSIGSVGIDVKELQMHLNQDLRTQVASFGSGSPGNETEYFGALTAAAVSKYQELYRDDILVPAGLVSGSGYVGPLTRAHLSTAQSEGGVSAQAIAPESISGIFGMPTTEFQDYDELTLAFPSRYDGPRGTKVRISGFGFTKENNTVHLGDSVTIKGVSSQSGTDITFTVPFDAPFGKHTLYVTNTKGDSNKNLFFVVTKPGVAKPTIESVSPEEGLYGEEVTITGSGFTAEGNEIFTSYDIVSDVSSPDGTTLTFHVLPFPESPNLEVGKDLNQGIEWPIWFYVVNGNGVGSELGKFILKI